MLRTRRRAFVDAMDVAAAEAAEQALTGRVVPHLNGAGIVAGYVAIGAEIDPAAILATAAAMGATIALPHVLHRDMPLRFLRWTPGAPLVAGPIGLLQPSADAEELAPDLVLTPLLGFDRILARLGQGAGYYDRALAAFPAARRIGLAWSVQEVQALPVDPWDMPLHAVATEREWIAP